MDVSINVCTKTANLYTFDIELTTRPQQPVTNANANGRHGQYSIPYDLICINAEHGIRPQPNDATKPVLPTLFRPTSNGLQWIQCSP